MSRLHKGSARSRPRADNASGTHAANGHCDGLNVFCRTGPVVLTPLYDDVVINSGNSGNCGNSTWARVLRLNTAYACFACDKVFVLEDESQVFGIENKGFALCESCALPETQTAAL